MRGQQPTKKPKRLILGNISCLQHLHIKERQVNGDILEPDGMQYPEDFLQSSGVGLKEYLVHICLPIHMSHETLY